MNELLKRRKSTDYVNNRQFLEELTIYRDKCLLAIQNNKDLPRVTPYIGECIYEICNRMSRRPNFSGYTQHWKDEMISDAILNCLAAVDNFNPEQSKKNPFGYFSRIAWHAFLRRIALEKKEQYCRHKQLQMMSFMEHEEYAEMLDLDAHNYIIENFEETERRNRESKNAKPTESTDN